MQCSLSWISREYVKKSYFDKKSIFFIPYLTQADLYLLHQPYGDTVGAWKAMEEAVRAGKIKSIGVSNHTVKLLSNLIPEMEILPAVNQMECNPFFQQKELRKYMEQYGISLEAWYPLGHADKELLSDVRLSKIAGKYGKSVVQVILRWHLQAGNIAIPGSSNEAHIQENFEIFDFELSEEEMQRMTDIDKDQRFAGY